MVGRSQGGALGAHACGSTPYLKWYLRQRKYPCLSVCICGKELSVLA